jgi:phosphodiesterase/alkaline phosphatase D-like protein
MHPNHESRHPAGTVRRSAARLGRVFGGLGRAIMASAMLLASGGALQPQSVLAQACANPIACENLQPGTPITTWDLSGGTPDDSILGFTDNISYKAGDTVNFKINTPSSSYSIDVYRLGYYGGSGARLVSSFTPSATLPQIQQPCGYDGSTGLTDCGNWALSASWAVPANAVTGVYLAKLTRTDTGYAGPGTNHIPFVVRDDASYSDIVFQTSDTTWQAYNDFGGNSFYTGNPFGRATKISYNRPFHTNVSKPESWLFADETPMIRYLEGNGFNVSYISGVDTDRLGGTILPNHKAFLSVGHDEYWSAAQRANVEAARDGPTHVNLAFFSGNESFWKTRWENSNDGANTPYRTLVSYKETQAPYLHDPAEPAIGTGTWRDPRFGADGGRPENALSGNIFMVNGTDNRALQVPASYSSLRFWRNTSVATAGAGGSTLTAGCSCVLGYEWDAEYDNGFRPAGLIDLSSSTYSVNTLLQDYGSIYAAGSATHHLTLYKAASGALVFGAGTVNYAAALDAVHSGLATTPDPALRQATLNLFADMGVQPSGTLLAGLALAIASGDTSRPTSSISSIAAGAHVAGGTDVIINGTAADTGGVVGSVEVSVDGGLTWHPASGTTAWSYTWRVNATPGTVIIKTRAVDDSANLETPGAGVSVTVDPAVCPCTIFHATDAPGLQGPPDAQAVQVGVRFRADQTGYINGIRFYKGASNTGQHIGALWTNAGQKLAQATFTNETATGWQQVMFGAPIQVFAGTTYVASYFAPNGGYSATPIALVTGIDNPPVHALRDGLDGANGVYQYVGGVPASATWSTFNSTNYWVDVVFNTTRIDGVAPTVVSNASTSGATGLALDATPTATFSEDVLPSTLALTLQDPSGAALAGQITYNQGTFTETFTPSGPLSLATTYAATIAGVQDVSGNPMAAPVTFNLSTPSCPCSFWNDQTIPAIPSQPDTTSVEVGMHFQTHVDGDITGIRFYQGPANTGTHVGNLWSSTGQNLASVTIPPSSGGWQTAAFSPAVYVQPGTDYVISYHAPVGGYSVNNGYFGSITTDVGPLKAPASVITNAGTIANGVFLYSAGGFPTNPTGTNYWVDPIFSPSIGGAGVQVQSQQQPVVDQTTASFVWTTDKLSDSLVVFGSAANTYPTSSLLDTKQVTAHSAQLTGLSPNTTYHYQVRSRDSAGNQANGGDRTFTTTPIPDTTAPLITNIVKNGENSSTKQLITWTTNEPADTRLAYGLTTTYGPQPPLVLDTASPVTSHSVELTNLSPSTVYHFQIGSRDPSLNLAQQPDDTFTTGNVQISGVNAQVASDASGDTAATISWTSDAPADTVLDYGLSASYGTNVTTPDPVTSHTVNLTGLTPGTTYHYRAQSTANSHTATSADLQFTTGDHQPPKITAIVTTQVDFTTETVNWTTDEPATSEVDYSTDTTYTSVVSSPLFATAHSLTLSNLTSGTMYNFKVNGVDAAGNPATTGNNTFTSKAQNPPQFTAGPSATPTYNSAAITWTTSVASDTQVKYGPSAPNYANPTTLVSTPVTAHTVNLTGLTPSTTYHYQALSRDPLTQLLATSSDLAFKTPAAPDTAPPVLTNVNAAVTTVTASITWTSSELADSQVEYGLTTSYGTSTTLDETLATNHIVSLTGLTPNTTYYFKVKSKDAAKNLATALGSFKTLPLPRSLNLNGTTAYAEAPNAAKFNSTSWTVEAWFKDTSPYGYNHLPTAILVKGDVVTDKEVPFAIGIAFNQLFITEKSNYSFSYVYYDLVKNHVTPNSWHHLAVSVNSVTHKVTLSIDGIDGVLIGTLSSVSTGNTRPVSVGRNGGSTGYANFQGKLDEVRIWKSVHTEHAAELTNAEIAAAGSDLAAYWKFNEGSGTTAVDAAPSPQNATLYGGATWSTDVHP